MYRAVTVISLLCLLNGAIGLSCQNPEVIASSVTTQDATVVSEIALVAEFSLNCANKDVPTSLYADIDGLILSVARIDDKFQVSWTEDIKTAGRGDRYVRIFDEEGYGALKKAIRSGESASDIAPLVTIVVNHPGAFAGPWLKSEFMAAALAFVVVYVAFTSKSKLLS